MDYPTSETSYHEALNWLFSRLPMFSRIGAAAYKPGLQNTLELDKIYHHPHTKFKTIHVGGTNGKGSTSHMLAAVLQANGYKTGLYTSPHLTDFRERMRINGKMIPKNKVIEFIDNWRSRQTSLRPSFFELTMMMAFDWFAKEHIDIAVIEVGMGGRLDSTNIISPLLSVITNISLDHTQFLGNTLAEIAQEKAGIIKPEIPVVIGEAEGEIKQVFETAAQKNFSPIIFANKNDSIQNFELRANVWECTLNSGEQIKVPLTGLYQEKNITTAITVLQTLKSVGVDVAESVISEGLGAVDSLTGLRGRWQKVSEHPDVICDTGHNQAGISEAMKTLKTQYPTSNLKFVIGFVNDKDVAHIVPLFPKDAQYYFTQAAIPRAMSSVDVRNYFQNEGISGKVFNNVDEAYQAAFADADKDDVIYVGGSTFIVADFLALKA